MQSFLAISAVLAGILTLAAGQTPVFGQNVYVFTVAESVSVGKAIGTINAAGSNVVYSLGSSDRGFSIDASTGVVTVGKSLDYEESSKVTIQITATNSVSSLSANAFMQIKITDVNDNAPVFVQAYTGTLKKTNGKITEMTPTTIAISAIDVDSGTNSDITFSIVAGQANADAFTINAATGELTLTKSITGASGSVNLVIEAADQGTAPLSTKTTVVLTIEDTDANKYRCVPWMVNRRDGNCYKLVRGRKTWDKAQKYCRWLGNKSGLKPGNLVTITESSTHDWIVTTLMRQKIPVWIGLNDQATEGTKTWTADGSSYNQGSFNNWASQSGDSAANDCVAIEGTSHKLFGKWKFHKCDLKMWSVCQFSAKIIP